MSAYVLGLMDPLNEPAPSQIHDYLREIDATLKPFAGRFLIHGGRVEVREGTWAGSVVLLEFDDLRAAQRWYDSPRYQSIRPWRTCHLGGTVILATGVDPGHRATDIIDAQAPEDVVYTDANTPSSEGVRAAQPGPLDAHVTDIMCIIGATAISAPDGRIPAARESGQTP
ncbi:MAG: DUF1330 domain-containing protein [Microbacterium enclense]